jgi:cell shape-determining protein MreC
MLVLLVLASLTLITLDIRGSSVIDSARGTASDLLSPVQRAARSAFKPVTNIWHGIFDYNKVKSENDRLRDQVAAQEGNSIAAEAAVRDYQELRALEGLEVPGGIPTVTAQVVGLPPSNFQLTVEIDQGSSRGIKVGMPVVTTAGMIGRVSQVTANRAVVRLLTDPELNVGAKIVPPGPAALPAPVPTTTTTAPPATTAPTTTTTEATTTTRKGQRATTTTAPPAETTTSAPEATTTTVAPTTTTRPTPLDQGYVHGNGKGNPLTVELVSNESGVRVGDVVVTSGALQGVKDYSLAPPGLPVGTVKSVSKESSSLEADVQVDPAADLDRLNYVKVVLYVPAP